MINRNKNSAVARAQAEMKQAINSSRRQLNSGRADNINPKYIAPENRTDAVDYKGYSIVKIQENDYTFTTRDEELDSRSFKSVADAKRAIDAELGDINSSHHPLDSARIGRTKEVKVLQGNYGYGWDDLIEYEVNDVSAKQDYRDYEENEPQYAHRIIRRRVPNPDYVEKEAVDEPVEVSSARHMSYKTRKAVEYSINCARRRARYGR